MTKSRISILMGLIVLMWIGASPIMAQSCSFSCNDTINVSVNRDCEALITADMVLEGYNFGSCPVPPSPRIYDKDGRIISNLLTDQYIGQYLKVQMTTSAQGTCWGYIKLEDKLPPEIVCPPDDTLKCNDIDYAVNNATLEARLKADLEKTIIDNCGNERLQINVIENRLSKECNNQFTATRFITFVALDNHANADTCRFNIYYEGVPPLDVDPPKNYTQSDALNCTTSYPLNSDSIPYPTVKYMLERYGGISMPNINGRALARLVDGVFITDNLCNFKVSYEDQVIPNCGGSYKIIRNWRVIDWCNTNIPIDFYQIIKVEDKTLNVTKCSTNRRLAAGRTTCEAVSALPRPEVSMDECSDWTWSIQVKGPDDADFVYVVKDLPSSRETYNATFVLGTSTVRYIVTDECDNVDECEYRVEVVDNSEPMVACDQRTIVSLNDDFKAKVYAKSFDDESFDGCSDITYHVRRIDGGCDGNSLFKDYVEFCCEDLGKTIMVELRVTDAAGLFNTCMAEAVIQFEGDIIDVTCPDNRDTFDCRTFDNFPFGSLTRPIIITDNECLGNLQARPVVRSEEIDECGRGYKNIDWTIDINDGERIVCTERFTFVNTNPFGYNDINWPDDRTITSCYDLDPTDQELDDLLPSTIPCANVLYSEPQDRVFDDIDHACLKVLRKWTVVDWCRYPDDPSAIWTYTQTIIVKESEAPAFDSSVAIIETTYGASCTASVRLRPLADDDCTDDEDLVWTRRLDVVSGVSTFPVIIEEEGKNIEVDLDLGDYVATWTATDECGNTTEVSKTFSIADDDKPIALCKDYRVAIDETTEVAIVAVGDLDDGSYDVCDDNVLIRIRRAGTNDPLGAQLLYTCDDVGTVDVELVVEDATGHVDQCIAQVTLTDPSNVCSPSFFGDVLPCGYVMDFDGDDDHITVPTLSITPSFTVEAYIYVEAQSGDFISLFEYGEDAPFLGLDGGALTIFGQIKDDQIISSNTWTHIAYTYDPEVNRSGIYINGVLAEVGAATRTFEGAGLSIAKRDSDQHFKGKMDEVRIWDRALTAQEVKANVPTIIDRKSEGLLAYYDFNAIAGVIIDRTDHEHVARLHGLEGDNALPQQELTTTPCPPDGSGANLEVTGHIATSDDIAVEDVSITMSLRDISTVVYSRTDVSGDYAIGTAKSSMDYTLTAAKNDDLANGINILDLVLLKRHLLGLGVIQDPYRLIAADLNDSKSLSVSDIALMQHIILDNNRYTDHIDSWKFITKDFSFADPLDPFNYVDVLSGKTSSYDMTAQDFVGVKMGDIDGSVRANSAIASIRAAHTLPLRLIKRSTDRGVRWDITVDETISLAGLQLRLSSQGQPLDVISGALPADDLIVGERGSVLWTADGDAIQASAGDVLYSIMSAADDLNIDKTLADRHSRAVDNDLRYYEVSWAVSERIEEDGLILAQNTPNPFTHATDIVFQIGSATDVSVSIFGLDGEQVYSHHGHYDRGRHSLNIDKNDTGLNKGIYYYQIKTHNRSLVRKMIVL